MKKMLILMCLLCASALGEYVGDNRDLVFGEYVGDNRDLVFGEYVGDNRDLVWEYDPTAPLTAYVDLWDEPVTVLTISCMDGNDVSIDISGEEVKVTGARECGAKILFEHYLKPMVDEYIQSKRQEILERYCWQWVEEKARENTIGMWQSQDWLILRKGRNDSRRQKTEKE